MMECVRPDGSAEGMTHMYYSYAMGVDDSVEQLSKEGFLIERDGGNYKVSFPADRAARWEGFISERLEEGYWNEYLAGDQVVFLFHLPEGFKKYEVTGFENDEVLKQCEKLCECRFESIYDMLSGNHFYRGKL